MTFRYKLSRDGYFIPSATGCLRSGFRGPKEWRVVIVDECDYLQPST